MCGIGLLIKASQPSDHRPDDKEVGDDLDAIAELLTLWEIDSCTTLEQTNSDIDQDLISTDVTVRTFFPEKTSAFSEEDLQEALRRRGPDQQACRKFERDNVVVSLFGAVLHLRGEELFKQPCCLPDGSAFAYNGEIFGLRNRSSFLDCVRRHAQDIAEDEGALERFATSRFQEEGTDSWLDSNSISDTSWLAECMADLQDIANGNDQHFDVLLKCLLEHICGPFALLHFCPRRNRVFGMRDVLGRRSLCVNVNPTGDVCLANVALGDSAVELHCTGAWVLEISPSSKSRIRFLPRSLPDPFADDVSFVKWRHISDVASDKRSVTHFQSLFNSTLREAVRKRVAHHNSVGLLFSGGLDSSVLAVLAAEEMLKDDSSSNKSLQLINVSFDPAMAPDRHTCLLSYRDILRRLNSVASRTGTDGAIDQSSTSFSSRIRSGLSTLIVELILIDETYSTVAADDASAKTRILSLLGPNNSHMDFNICACLWRGAAGGITLDSLRKSYFSVTPDSLGCECFEKLVNTAYVAEFKRGGDNIKSKQRLENLARVFGTAGNESCIGGFQQDLLRNLFPNEFGDRNVHETVDVLTNGNASNTCSGYSDPSKFDQRTDGVNRTRDDEIAHSGNDSGRINVSLYNGQCVHEQNGLQSNEDDKSHQRNVLRDEDRFKVLLLGHGADEILGGYARHISSFEQRGIEGLQQELLLDCRRLWTRNLGRDDRVVSDWGREARHPFLDEDFIEAVVNILPCLPDKLWLRNFAACELGLAHSAARYEKRAIQFGTRIAKQSNSIKFESNRKAKGQQKYV